MGPALDDIATAFNAQLAPEFANISALLLQLAQKTEEMELEAFMKYFAQPNDSGNVLRLALNHLLGRSKKVNIREAVGKLGTAISSRKSESGRVEEWMEASEGKSSLLEAVMKVVEPHQIVGGQLELTVTNEHLNELAGRTGSWVHSYYPAFTLPQFLDFAAHRSPLHLLPPLITHCVLKHGLHALHSSVRPTGFPLFYAKVRSSSKLLAKLTPTQLSRAYRCLSDSSGQLSLPKMFRAAQNEISGE